MSDRFLHNAVMETRDLDPTALLDLMDERDRLIKERDKLISQVVALQTVIHEMRIEKWSTCLECGHPLKRACTTHAS